MEIGHEPRSCVLGRGCVQYKVDPSFTCFLFLPFVYTIINRPSYFFCSSNSVCRTHSFKVLVCRFHSLSRQIRCFFFPYIFLIYNPKLIQDAYHFVQLRRCRPTGGSLCLPGLPQLQTRGEKARPPVRSKFESRDKYFSLWDRYFSLWDRPHNLNYPFWH